MVPSAQLVRAQQHLTQELRRALAAEEEALAEAGRARRDAQSVQRQMAMQEASLKREALEAMVLIERKHKMDLEECKNVTADEVRAVERRLEGDKEKFLERYRTEMLRVKELLGTELVVVQKERDMLRDELDALNARLSEEEVSDDAGDESPVLSIKSPSKSPGKTPAGSRRASMAMLTELEAANLQLMGEVEKLKIAKEAAEAEAKKRASEAAEMRRGKERAEEAMGEMKAAFQKNEEEVDAMRAETEVCITRRNFRGLGCWSGRGLGSFFGGGGWQ